MTTPYDEVLTKLLMMVDGDVIAIDDAASTVVNADNNERVTFTLGDQQDHVLVATSDEVTITSMSEPCKSVSTQAHGCISSG